MMNPVAPNVRPKHTQFCPPPDAKSPLRASGQLIGLAGFLETRMPSVKDLTGMRFGKLVVSSWRHARTSSGTSVRLWLFTCDCGRVGECSVGRLTNKAHPKMHCGCMTRENLTVHGRSNSRIYAKWQAMIQRCINPNASYYYRYGGRGITVCDRWLESFENFYADMGNPPSIRHSIDRIDNDGNYQPENCRWATAKEQGRNTSRTKVMTLDGVTKPLIDWAKDAVVSPYTFKSRMTYGWDLRDALTMGVHRGVKRRKQKTPFHYKGAGVPVPDKEAL